MSPGRSSRLCGAPCAGSARGRDGDYPHCTVLEHRAWDGLAGLGLPAGGPHRVCALDPTVRRALAGRRVAALALVRTRWPGPGFHGSSPRAVVSELQPGMDVGWRDWGPAGLGP